MKLFFKRKPKGFKLTVVLGSIKLTLDLPSS